MNGWVFRRMGILIALATLIIVAVLAAGQGRAEPAIPLDELGSYVGPYAR